MSVEAADIYKQEQENGVAVGYKLPEDKSDACFRLFKVLLDVSLDSTELEKAYKRICRKKFSFQDNYENSYTLAVVNVKFNYIYKPQDGSLVNLKSLREHFYARKFYRLMRKSAALKTQDFMWTTDTAEQTSTVLTFLG